MSSRKLGILMPSKVGSPSSHLPLIQCKHNFVDIKEDLHSVRQSVIGRLKGQKQTPSAVSQALVAPPVALASARSSSDHSSQPDRPKVKMSVHVVSFPLV